MDNFIGFKTFTIREIKRFIKVWSQTLIGPLVTNFLFLAVFHFAIGIDRTVGDMPYILFLIPGLVMMSMIQNSFANSSSSLMTSKIMGNLTDTLMAPLHIHQLLLGWVIGGITRAACIGLLFIICLMPFIKITFHDPLNAFLFFMQSSIFMATAGVLAGIWAQKFDQMSVITNFVVAPLSFLSGTFYTITVLPEVWQKICLFNPIYHAIHGWRYGMIGHTDTNIMISHGVLLMWNIVFIAMALFILKKGYRLKN